MIGTPYEMAEYLAKYSSRKVKSTIKDLEGIYMTTFTYDEKSFDKNIRLFPAQDFLSEFIKNSIPLAESAVDYKEIMDALKSSTDVIGAVKDIALKRKQDNTKAEYIVLKLTYHYNDQSAIKVGTGTITFADILKIFQKNSK